MKKIIFLSLVFLLGVFIISCDDTTTDPILPDTGNIVVNSTPQGAQIWLDDVNTNQVTPHTFADKDVAVYKVTLKLENYADTTLFVDVVKDQDATINPTLKPLYQNFSTPVRIWETTGTTAAQPSGLDLSTGSAYGTSDVANRGNIDIYYFSSSDGTTFLVQSSHLNANMTRETFFKIGTASNLSDGVDSPAKDATWATAMTDREANYVFLYDADGNYSKLKIANFGGGTGPGDPAWVELIWIYNKAKDNRLF